MRSAIAAGALVLGVACGVATAFEHGSAMPSVQAETLEELSNLIRAGLVGGSKDAVVLDALTQGAAGRERGLAAGRQDCDEFLTLTLAPLTTECSVLSSDLQSLATTSEQCQRVYDFSKPKLDAICSNKCYAAMVDALDKMSKAGCSVDSVTATMCNQCPDNTVCAKGGVCREACSAKKPCRCGGECVAGGCKPSDQIGVQRADMGTFGYKVSLEHLCLAPPAAVEETVADGDATAAADKAAAAAAGSSGEYCFTSMFGAINAGLDMGACDRVAATGCCAGTVFQYGRQCALANETISTALGPIKLGDIEALCGNVDFQTKCSNAPTYEAGMCKPEYLEAGGTAALPFPGMEGLKSGGFSYAGVYAFIGAIAAMCCVLFAVTGYQKWSNQKRFLEAKKAADAMPPAASSPVPAV